MNFRLRDWLLVSSTTTTTLEVVIWNAFNETVRGQEPVQLMLMWFYLLFIPTLAFVFMLMINLFNTNNDNLSHSPSNHHLCSN